MSSVNDSTAEVTEDQLLQLDELLSNFDSLEKSSATKVNGDDVDMINNISAAAAAYHSGDQKFLDSIVHIKSSYSSILRTS